MLGLGFRGLGLSAKEVNNLHRAPQADPRRRLSTGLPVVILWKRASLQACTEQPTTPNFPTPIPT